MPGLPGPIDSKITISRQLKLINTVFIYCVKHRQNVFNRRFFQYRIVACIIDMVKWQRPPFLGGPNRGKYLSLPHIQKKRLIGNRSVMGGKGAYYDESKLKTVLYGSISPSSASLSRADLKAVVTSGDLFFSVCSTVIRISRVLAPTSD